MNKFRELDRLTKALMSTTVDKRIAAIRAMSTLLAKQSAPEALINALRDRNELVRVEAVEALEAIGDRTSLPSLWKALNDRSPLVRRYAAIAIGSLGTKKDVSRLTNVYKRDRSANAQIGYALALYRLGKLNAIQDLLRLLEHRAYVIRCAAAHALERCDTNTTDTNTALQALRDRLGRELTIAVRSSIRSSIRSLKELCGNKQRKIYNQ